MTDLTRGFVEINGFTFGPETTLEEVKAFFADAIDILDKTEKYGFIIVSFKKRYDITGEIAVNQFKFGKDFSLEAIFLRSRNLGDEYKDNLWPDASLCLDSSKRWLRETLPNRPLYEGDKVIAYSFVWGSIYAGVYENVHYGLVDGNIKILYRKK